MRVKGSKDEGPVEDEDGLAGRPQQQGLCRIAGTPEQGRGGGVRRQRIMEGQLLPACLLCLLWLSRHRGHRYTPH